MPGFVRPDRLRQMIEAGEQRAFLVVDVRPRSQYRLDHIPGAVNVPLNEIESRIDSLGVGGDVVFYCRNGVRSKVAAILAVDGGLDSDRAFTLEGGISAYSGEILLDLPRLTLFEGLTDPGGLAAAALNFEKGAWRFYTAASQMDLTPPVIRFLEKMAGLESDHARALFEKIPPNLRQTLSFDDYFKACPGDILEGGRSFDRVIAQAGENPMADDILDLAFEIEVGAYDLYRQSGFGCKSDPNASFFLGLAADEKKHMAMISDFLSRYLFK